MDEGRVGTVTHHFRKAHVAVVKLDAPLAVGQRVHVPGAHDDFESEVGSMQIEHGEVREADRGDEVGLKVPERVHENSGVWVAAR